MQQTKQKISAINSKGGLGQLRENKIQPMDQKQQHDFINCDLYKTATFFDPFINKEQFCGEQTQHERNASSKGSVNVYQPCDTFKPSETLINQKTAHFKCSRNGLKLQQEFQNNENDLNCNIPQLSSAQSNPCYSNRKRPLLAFKLSPSSTKAIQMTSPDDRVQETNFDFIQSVQDAEFWNKVNMIISGNEENSNKNQNQERLITLPSINQKGEYVKKSDRNTKNKSNQLPIWDMGSSCSTRDSLRQNQHHFQPEQHLQPLQQHKKLKKQQQNQKQNLHIPLQNAVTKKLSQHNDQFLKTNPNSNSAQRPSLYSPSSDNIRSLISSPQQIQSSQYSSQLDSIKTEESANIYSPEQVKGFALPSDSLNLNSNNSENQSTNPPSSVSVGPILNSSRSSSFFNSQLNQIQSPISQPYFQNNLINRTKSPKQEFQIQNPSPNKKRKNQPLENLGKITLIKQTNSSPENDLESIPLQNFQSLQTEQSDKPIEKDNFQFHQSMSKGNLYIPQKFVNLQQSKIRRDNFASFSLNDQTNQLSQKHQNIQSHKHLNSLKNEDTNNIIMQQDLKRKTDWKQNILLKDNVIIQLNTSSKKQQFSSFQLPLENLSINQLNSEKSESYQFLKCNEDISIPGLSVPNSGNNSYRLHSCENENVQKQMLNTNKQIQLNIINDDILRRSMQGKSIKNDFSFSEEGANNLIKITQSAQGCREQAKKLNLRSKQQENLVKKLFKIEEKVNFMSNSLIQNNYFNSELGSLQQQKLIKYESNQ